MNEEIVNNNMIYTNREHNLDIMRAIAIIAMIICHCVIRLSTHIDNYEMSFSYKFAYVFLGEYAIVAHGLMFAMGVVTNYSKKNRPIDLIKRGILIYFLAYVLNFCRYGIYAVIDGLIESKFHDDTLYALIGPDIFHFAGIALILTGILKKLKCKNISYVRVGIALAIVGGIISGIDFGNYTVNYIIGHFVFTTDTTSYFPLFNWYIFVSIGVLFGGLLKNTKNKDKFYLKLLIPSIVVMVVYITLVIIFGRCFLTRENEYRALSLGDAIGLLSIDFTFLSLIHFLLKKVNIEKLTPLITMSKNITIIYFIHWCIIGFIESIFCYLLGIKFPYWFMYLFGVLLIFISFFLSKLYFKAKNTILKKHLKK